MWCSRAPSLCRLNTFYLFCGVGGSSGVQMRAKARRKKTAFVFFLPPLFCISMSAQMSRDRRSARKDPYLCKCANVCVCESGIDPVRLVKKCRRFLSQMWTSRSVYVTVESSTSSKFPLVNPLSVTPSVDPTLWLSTCRLLLYF